MITSNTEKPLQSQTQRTSETFQRDQKSMLLKRRATTDLNLLGDVTVIVSFLHVQLERQW